MLYSYQKATPAQPSPGKVIPRYLKVLPLLISALGLGLLTSVIWPLVSYQVGLFLHRQNSDTGLLSPIYYESFANETIPDDNQPVILGEVDYTKASNWFTFSPSDLPAPPPSQAVSLREYKLSIPTLGIKDALVKINSDDLSQSLIQYQQTAFPGQLGSPVIFGHSTLPQFFNPENYLTIFSTLPTLKIGADIFVNYDGVGYTYRIKKMYEVKPDEVWVLRQDYTQKTLKLITCVPPGTKLRRLIIEADLVKT